MDVATARWLWDYHDWARSRVWPTLREASEQELRRPGMIAGGHSDGSVLGALLHILDTEESWLARWRREREPEPIDEPDVAAVAERWEKVEFGRQRFLAGLAEADLEWRPPGAAANLGQAIVHVSNHTTHHRAEALVGLTALGFRPPELDVMDFVRDVSPSG